MLRLNQVSPDLMPLIVTLGAKSIRDNGGSWDGVEKTKGVFNFSLVPVYDQAKALGLEPTFILAFSNALYTGNSRAAPWNMSGYRAYANYALKSMETYVLLLLRSLSLSLSLSLAFFLASMLSNCIIVTRPNRLLML